MVQANGVREMRRHALRRPIFIVLVAILGTGTVHGQDPAGKEAQKSAAKKPDTNNRKPL
jgi:hypothetical protein